MDIDATSRRNGERLARKDRAESGDDEQVATRGDERPTRRLVLQGGGLVDRETVTPRGLSHGALGEAQPAPRGPVGLRDHEGDVVARLEDRLERACGEGRRPREGDAQPRAVRQAAFRWRFLSFARTRFCLSSESRSTNTLPSR